jgi:hypothetical protein
MLNSTHDIWVREKEFSSIQHGKKGLAMLIPAKFYPFKIGFLRKRFFDATPSQPRKKEY